MSNAQNDLRIDYIEFAAKNLDQTKKFYSTVFGWTFEDYGPEYCAFRDGRLSGGFYASEDVKTGGALIVIYATDLEAMEKKVLAAGSKIVKPIFDFPGGRRFHFADPNGHELALWTDN